MRIILAVVHLLVPLSALAVRPDQSLQNQVPATEIVAGPADSSATNYRVWFHWAGSDADGVVDHFDWILVDHPASNDSIGPGGNDPVVVVVPAPDDPRWTSIWANDSVFVTLADTLRRDPKPGPGETPEFVRSQPFDRWHTFFVRAVDDSGSADPTPAYRSFDSQTLAPTVNLLPPVVAGSYFTAPPVVVFHWDGEDLLGGGTATTRPVASRWVLIPSRFDVLGGFTSYPDSLYHLPSGAQWSAWQPWDLPNGAGREAVITGLQRIGEAPGSGHYIFAVQALDEAGAITPVFDYATPGKNNVALIRVTGEVGPILTVRDPVLGMQTFSGSSQPISLDIVAGQTLAFRWSADASRYGGTITGYRYGWDILNPDNDEEWSEWSLATTSAPMRTFSAGTHRFFVQTRDNAGSTSRAIYELHVFQSTWSRDILWVDDTDHQTDSFSEGVEDARWKSVLRFIDDISRLSFDENLDVYDVQEHLDAPPDLALLLDYRVVIWSCRSGSTGTSGLRRTAQFFDPIPERNRNTSRTFNILNVYIANGGRLWINGFRPAKQLWPDERAFGTEADPVNVTNWDDPLQPHPDVDSVGTSSLLYRMGIEMLDIGAGVNSRRTTVAHYCYGLRRAAPLVRDLIVDTGWGQGGTGGRASIEIFDMPQALGSQLPPLAPPAGKSLVLYTYVSQVLEDPAQNVFYPLTADNQPLLLVTKNKIEDSYFPMAFCGFEPYLLVASSHEYLTQEILMEKMMLDPTPVFLQQFAAVFDDGVVRVHWALAENSDPADFDLRATSGALAWSVPFTAVGDRAFEAVDDSPRLAGGGSVTYSLFAREAGQAWVLLGQETVTLAAVPPPRLQLLPPQPNPFNPRVRLAFVLPARQHVRLDIYTAEGRRVSTLVDAVRPAGPGTIDWDGNDATGRSMPSGLYLVLLDSGGVRLSRKLVLMK